MEISRRRKKEIFGCRRYVHDAVRKEMSRVSRRESERKIEMHTEKNTKKKSRSLESHGVSPPHAFIIIINSRPRHLHHRRVRRTLRLARAYLLEKRREAEREK